MRPIRLALVTAALVSLLAAVDCTQRLDCEGRYHFHSSFPADLKPGVEAGVAKWNAFGAEPVSIEAGDPSDEACSFRVISKESDEYANSKVAIGEFAAKFDGSDMSIAYVTDKWPSNWHCDSDRFACVTWITMHEVAHAHGMKHVADKDAVMGVTNPRPRLDYNASDREECVSVGACR